LNFGCYTADAALLAMMFLLFLLDVVAMLYIFPFPLADQPVAACYHLSPLCLSTIHSISLEHSPLDTAPRNNGAWSPAS
jgi:hypothetical protein